MIKAPMNSNITGRRCNHMKRKLSMIICVVLLVCTLLSLSSCEKYGENTEKVFDTLESLDGKKAGVFVGSVFDQLILDALPNTKISYYSSSSECAAALLEGKIDFTINEEGQSLLAVRQNPELTVLPYKLDTYQYGAIFNKNEAGYLFCNDFNKFLMENWSKESLNYLYSTWISNDNGKSIDYDSLQATNGIITVATDVLLYPFSYIRDGKVTGFEIELIYEYCKNRGYGLKLDIYDFSGVLAAVSSGRADIGMSSVIITEERKNNYYFSESYAEGSPLIIVRKENAPGEYNNVSQLNGKNIGAQVGSVYLLNAMEKFANSSISSYNSADEIFTAVSEGSIDAGIVSAGNFDDSIAEKYGILSIGSIISEDIAFAVSKSDKGSLLKDKINGYINMIRENGDLEKITKKWFYEDIKPTLDFSRAKNINGKIVVGVATSVGAPFCYREDGKLTGFDIEIILGFAELYGYGVEFIEDTFTGMLVSVSNGVCDVAASNITITEERKTIVQFTEPYYNGKVLVVVKKQGNSASGRDFFSKLWESIRRTLIEEDRYLLYIDGIITTCLISGLSAIFGLIIGYLLFLLYKAKLIVPKIILKIYNWMIEALPGVVVLMIFYYVFFASSRINGVWVSVFAFTAIFSATVFGMIKTSFMAVDLGQYEAAYALGYSKGKTIREIIFPQVLPIFLSPFKRELINLFKATSVVGFIAVQDVTKISDIIRSRTYEAFFPLIATAIIYFVMAYIMAEVIKLFEFKINPLHRKRVIKGIKKVSE